MRDSVSLITECICLKHTRLHGYRTLLARQMIDQIFKIYIYTDILIRVTQIVQEGQKNDDEVRLYVRKTNRLLYNIYIYLSFNCILKYNRNN